MYLFKKTSKCLCVKNPKKCTSEVGTACVCYQKRYCDPGEMKSYYKNFVRCPTAEHICICNSNTSINEYSRYVTNQFIDRCLSSNHDCVCYSNDDNGCKSTAYHETDRHPEPTGDIMYQMDAYVPRIRRRLPLVQKYHMCICRIDNITKKKFGHFRTGKPHVCRSILHYCIHTNNESEESLLCRSVCEMNCRKYLENFINLPVQLIEIALAYLIPQRA